MKYKPWLWVAAALLLALSVTAVFVWIPQQAATSKVAPANHLTQAVDRGDVARVVRASGALSPVNVVQVGSQVSGTIKRLHVDYNSAVKAGQLLAELDATVLEAELAQASAQLRSAQANLEAAQVKFERTQKLFLDGFYSGAELDSAQSAWKVAQAQMQQQQASVARAKTNIGFALIRSPVNGTVVSKEISVGQTVAATLQTPVLFKIAQDLREVQIETNVSEADIGLLSEGQEVSFTVDAFPDRVYKGIVQQIRNNHTLQQNVVTYTAVVRSMNEDLSLRPGMTAYVAVTVARRAGVLRVSNAALRYEPAKSMTTAIPASASNQRVVWRQDASGQLQAVEVSLGLSDGRYTELLSGDLRSGDPLIIGDKVPSSFSGPKIF
ncbi:MAG: efflux RND transporter periplasmic adaptor subunit [Rhizobacter sp.]